MEVGETAEVLPPPADTVEPLGMLTITWPWDKGTTEEFIPVGLLNKFWKKEKKQDQSHNLFKQGSTDCLSISSRVLSN